MKHKLFISLFAPLALLSCANESVEKGGDGAEKISFATRLDADEAITRGTMIKNPADIATAGGFKVWAFSYTGTWQSPENRIPMMNGIPVTSSDGVEWTYGTTPQEWPDGRKVSFFAYAPFASATDIEDATDGTPRISFAVNNNVDDQIDLLISTPVKDQTAVTALGRPVGMYFKHALARISFSGLLVDGDNGDDREIYVKEITINGLYGSGTTPLVDPAVWVPIGDPNKSYSVSIAGGELEDTQLTHEAPMLTTDDSYLFLIPQTLARPLGEDPTMDVVLEIDGTEVEYTSLVFSPQAWLPGKSYNYQIAVHGNTMRIIYIDSDIALDDWNASIILQTMALTSSEDEDRDKERDQKNIAHNVNTLNEVRSFLYSHLYNWYGLYFVNSLTHDITIDMEALLPDNRFTNGQHFMIDAKKMINKWEGAGTAAACKITVINYENDWVIVDGSFDPNEDRDIGVWQWPDPTAYPNVDATSGATLPALFPKKNSNPVEYVEVQPSATLYNKGSLILKRINNPLP